MNSLSPSSVWSHDMFGSHNPVVNVPLLAKTEIKGNNSIYLCLKIVNFGRTCSAKCRLLFSS